MNNYFCIENTLYNLTKKQVEDLEKIFPPDLINDRNIGDTDTWTSYLDWIEKNGKNMGYCKTFNY